MGYYGDDDPRMKIRGDGDTYHKVMQGMENRHYNNFFHDWDWDGVLLIAESKNHDLTVRTVWHHVGVGNKPFFIDPDWNDEDTGDFETFEEAIAEHNKRAKLIIDKLDEMDALVAEGSATALMEGWL